MIPKIGKPGKSFTGYSTYICHDPKAQTANRVAWTHTLNCANDHVPSAIDEMLWTYRDAELLKQEAGIRPGGRRVESPVKGLSLNWARSDPTLTRDEMIETAEEFLKFMGWEAHQAVLVAHADKEYQHLHIMLNRIHPETGKAINDAQEWRKAQAWALEYERSHEMIHCQERLKPAGEREASPPREAALILKEIEREFEKSEAARRNFEPDYLEKLENRKIIQSEEWKILKDYQRHEREAHFTAGKSEFTELRKEIYREVREEFREQWAEFYASKRNGDDADALSAMRAEILEAQRSTLAERRDAACAELRAERDADYRGLLDVQKEGRADLIARQEQGLNSPQLLDLVNQTPEAEEGGATYQLFHKAADEVFGSERQAPAAQSRDVEEEFDLSWPPATSTSVRPGLDIAGNLGMGMLGGLGAIGESLFDGFFGGGGPPRQPQPPRAPSPKPEFPRHNPFAHFAEEMQQQAKVRQEESDRAWWDERYARHRD